MHRLYEKSQNGCSNSLIFFALSFWNTLYVFLPRGSNFKLTVLILIYTVWLTSNQLLGQPAANQLSDPTPIERSTFGTAVISGQCWNVAVLKLVPSSLLMILKKGCLLRTLIRTSRKDDVSDQRSIKEGALNSRLQDNVDGPTFS